MSELSQCWILVYPLMEQVAILLFSALSLLIATWPPLPANIFADLTVTVIDVGIIPGMLLIRDRSKDLKCRSGLCSVRLLIVVDSELFKFYKQHQSSFNVFTGFSNAAA
jgi:hypothetical protein